MKRSSPSVPRRVGLREIASAAGVCLMTVSLSLRGSSKISVDTRNRIQRLAINMGYRPDPEISRLMRHLRSSQTSQGRVGQALVDFYPGSWFTENSYNARIRKGAMSADDRIPAPLGPSDVHDELRKTTNGQSRLPTTAKLTRLILVTARTARIFHRKALRSEGDSDVTGCGSSGSNRASTGLRVYLVRRGSTDGNRCQNVRALVFTTSDADMTLRLCQGGFHSLPTVRQRSSARTINSSTQFFFVGPIFDLPDAGAHTVYNAIDVMPLTFLRLPTPCSAARRRMDEALVLLADLGLPAELDAASALALLGLSGLEPDAEWSTAHNPMLSVTELINFAKRRYRFEDATEIRPALQTRVLPGFFARHVILMNPDDPRRPRTSRYCVHQLAPNALAVIRAFGSRAYPDVLASYRETSADRVLGFDASVANEDMVATLPSGERLRLRHEPASELIRSVLEVFCAKFAPGGRILYVAGAPEAHPFRHEHVLESYGLVPESAAGLPDLVIHDTRKNRLVLVELGSVGRLIDEPRRRELADKFSRSTRRLVMITAFGTRLDLVRTIDQICCHTAAWIADSPLRLIQFDSPKAAAKA
ncbi:MAG: BsuBI/PstI family type II restriction endonuclease [Opitutus sp.]